MFLVQKQVIWDTPTVDWQAFCFPFQLLWTNLMTAIDVWVFLLFLPASSANGLAFLLFSAPCGTNTHNFTLR